MASGKMCHRDVRILSRLKSIQIRFRAGRLCVSDMNEWFRGILYQA